MSVVMGWAPGLAGVLAEARAEGVARIVGALSIRANERNKYDDAALYHTTYLDYLVF